MLPSFMLLLLVGVTPMMVSAVRHVAGILHSQGAGTKAAACTELLNGDKQDVVNSIPGDVYVLLERRSLQQEYRDLTEALLVSNRGRTGMWKGSAVARTMFVGGHEQAFETKNVSLFLTQRADIVPTVTKMCLVDRTQQPTFIPAHIYHDAKRVRIGHGAIDSLGVWSKILLPEGVFGQSLDSRHPLSADMSTMDVDVARLLKNQNLLLENMELVGKINIAEEDSFWRAKIVSDFQAEFRAKGVSLFIGARTSKYSCGIQGTYCHSDYFWLEYADLSVTGQSYTPKVSGKCANYPLKKIQQYRQCKTGDSKNLAVAVALKAGQQYWGKCGDVAGAVSRDSKRFPDCKCKYDDDMVFCGDSRVAGRKFKIGTVLSLSGCEKQKAYCGPRACIPPRSLQIA